MKYLPLILILAVVSYVFYLNWMNHNKNRAPKWIITNLPGDRKAVTMPPFGIYVEPDVKERPEVIKHEICHWNQYLNKGLYKFYSDYIEAKNKFEYHENPMETECFKNEL